MGKSSSHDIPNFHLVKHLSHVFLDGEIRGTPLDEGSTLNATVPLLKGFMSWLKVAQPSAESKFIAELAKQSFQKDTHHNLDGLIKQFEQMSDFEDRKNDKKLNQEILNAYEKDGEVFFPGGWSGKGGQAGHAMTYRLQRVPNTNETILMIYNTGSGVQYHGTSPLPSGKQGYYPVYGFKFNYDPKNKEKVLAVLDKLCAARRSDGEEYNAKKLYKEVFETAAAWLNAKNIPGAELSPAILGQRDGTCVWHSCMQAMQSGFKNKESFRQFMLAFRLYLLDTVVDEKDINLVEKYMPGYRKLLKQCLANTTRMLDMNLKAGVKEWNVSTDNKETILLQVEKWKKALEKHEPKRNKNVSPSNISPESTTSANSDFVVRDMRLNDAVPPKKVDNNYRPEQKTFIEALKDLNNLPLDEVRETELIERFCFAFSDPTKPLFRDKNAVTIEEIMLQMEMLKNKYIDHHKSLTPRSTVIRLALMSLMDRVCEEGMIAPENKALSCLPIFIEKMLPFVQRTCANPFLATNDAHLDLMRERILTFYEDKQKKFKEQKKAQEKKYDPKQRVETFKYYIDILKQAPESEKAAIKEEWAKDKLIPTLEETIKSHFSSNEQSPEDSYFYSYLKDDPKNYGRRKKMENTPRLNRLFGFQERIERYQADLLTQMTLKSEKSGTEADKEANPYNREIYFKFYKSDIGYPFMYETYMLLKPDSGHLLLDTELLEKHFALATPAVRHALTSDYDNNHLNSNEIAFSPQRSVFSKNKFMPSDVRQVFEKEKHALDALSDEDRQESKLHRLRISPECVVLSILSELAENPEWLANEEMQQYIFLSIFQPGALLKTLKAPNDLWEMLDKLFKKCHFSDDPACPEKSEWFLLNLAAKISAYALEANNLEKCLDEKTSKACLGWQRKLLQAVAARMQMPNVSTEMLIEYNTLKLNALLHLDSLTKNDMNDLADAYLLLMLLPESNKVGNVLKSENLKHALEKASDVLAANPQFTSTISDNIIKLLQDRAGITGALQFDKANSVYPELRFKDGLGNPLVVYFSSRQILYQNKLISYLPQAITSSEEYKHLFGSEPLLATQSNNQYLDKCYQFTKNAQSYRIIHSRRGMSFQKEHNGKWYTLSAPTEPLAKARKIPFAAFTLAPPLFQQANYWCWVNNSNDYFIETGTNNTKVYERHGDHLLKVNVDGKSESLTPVPHNTLLQRLEGHQFIELLNDNTYYLPRYGLTFIKEGETFYTADKRYRLELPEEKADRFGSGLIMRATNGSGEDKYLMPLQPYFRFLEEGVNAISFQFYHDISNLLPENALFNKELKADPTRLGWDFDRSERYVEFSYAQNNTYHAQSAADKIYLAYLYMMQDQPSKALEYLTSCEYQGTADEMQRLWWLLNKLPVITDSKIEPIINSKTLAIKMQAMHAMTELKKNYPACRMLPDLGRVNSDTAWFKNDQRNQLQDYIDKLHVHAAKLYEEYDNRRNNIPAAMKLSSENEKNILSFIQAEHEVTVQDKAEKQRQEKEEDPNKKFDKKEDKIPPQYVGVIGTRYLERFAETTSVSNYLAEQRQLIDVKDPLGGNTATLPYGLSQNMYVGLDESSAPNAKSALTPWISPEDFMRYFPIYYRWARDKNSPHQKELLQFCQAYLTLRGIHANMEKKDYEKLSEESKAIILMVSGLWAVQHAPDKFPLSCNEIKGYCEESAKVYNIFNILKDEYKTVLENFPIPLVGYDDIKQEHTVKPITQPTLPVASRELVSSKNIFDPLDSIPGLMELRQELKNLEVTHEANTEKLLQEMSGINDEKLSAKNAILENVDTRLLASKKEVDENQLKVYANHKRAFSADLLEKLTINEQRVNDLEKNAAKAIEAILQKRKKQTVAEVGKQRHVPTVDRLVKSYTKLTHADYLAYGIAEADIAPLQAGIENLLAVANSKQRLVRIKHTLSKDLEKSTKASQHAVIAALLSENKVTSKHAAVFQYIGKLGLYPKQARVLEILFEKSPTEAISYLIKLIMGGGKTKVIMPLLLSLLADGSKLPIVLVPDSSLNTNFSDLRATSLHSLQQNAHLFQFDRDTPSEPSRLRHIYESFATALKHKEYFVTSPACMQSLDLKYFEILFTKNHANPPLSPEKAAIANEQLHWLGLTRKLLKTQGTVVIDESHLLLHIRKELNYALGKRNQIDDNTSDMVASLFAWLNKVPVVLNSGQKLSFLQLLKDPNHLTDEKMAKDLCQYYVEQMCEGELRADFVDGLLVSGLTAEDLKKYLLDNVSAEEEKKIHMALEVYPPIMARWLLLREQFSHLFKLTIRSKIHENYGPDVNNPANPFAIPYRAVNSPTPYIFANFLEAYNYTAQMIYCDGIKREHFAALLQAWSNQAHLERQTEPTIVSATERKFNYIFDKETPPLSLLRLNLSDKKLMDQLYDKYARTPILVQQVLRETLSTLTLDEAILRSDTLNLVAMFDKAVAFSATPENHHTYHSKINMVYETSFLIESQVMDYLQEKKTAIDTIVSNSQDENSASSDFIQQIANAYQPMSVLLDCGGRLRGLYNINVVKELDKAYRDKNMKYILFYQGSDLFAWKVNGGMDQEPTKLTSTDPDAIQAELGGCPPEQRFTFLDQEHTVGVDIKQAPDARAVVTVDIKTTISSFLQAVMRMRDFANNQQVVIAIDPKVKALMESHQSEGLEPLQQLFAFLKNNQVSQLEVDHFSSAIKKIRNFFREDLDNRLLNEEDSLKRDQAYRLFEQFFIENQTDNIIALYKQQAKSLKTKDILNVCVKNALNDWRKCLLGTEVTPTEVDALSEKMRPALKAICQEAVKICAEENIYPVFQGNREMQIQKQQLKQAQKKIELKKLDERKSPTLAVRNIDLKWIEQLFTNKEVTPDPHVKLSDATRKYSKNKWEFDEKIYASSNLLYAYENQEATDVYNVYTKMPTAILFEKTVNGLKAILVSAEEAEELKKRIIKNDNNLRDKFWLTTLSGANFTPQPKLDAPLLKMRNAFLEQASFFYGRVDILYSLPSSEWLSEKIEEKMDFLQKTIKPALAIHEDQLERLFSKFNKLGAFIECWAKYPLDSTIVSNELAKASTITKNRLDKILPFLRKIRQTNEISPVDKLIEKIGLQDALLVDEYQTAWQFLLLLKEKKFDAAATFFMNNVEKFPISLVCYAVPTQGVSLTENEITQFASKLTKQETKIAWIRQVCMRSDLIALLSQERFAEYMSYMRAQDFCYYVKNILTDDDQRITLINRYLLLPTVTDNAFLLVANMIKDADEAFKTKAAKGTQPLALMILLNDANIEDEDIFSRLRDREHREAILYLHQNKLLLIPYLQRDLTKIVNLLKDIQVDDVDHIKKILDLSVIHDTLLQLHAKKPLEKEDIGKFIKLIQHLESFNLLNKLNAEKLKDPKVLLALFSTLDFSQQYTLITPTLLQNALDDPMTVLAEKVLSNHSLKSASLLVDLQKDPKLKENFANHYSLKMPHLSTNTCKGIQALVNLRDSLRTNKAYAKYLNSLDHFTREAISVLLSNDGKKHTKNLEKNIMTALDKSAHKHFKQRHLALRICVDVFMALTVVGFFVFAVRKLAGKSFFFSQATTERQNKFDSAVVTSQGWNPKMHRRH